MMDFVETEQDPRATRIPQPVSAGLRLFIMIAVPFLLVIGNSRLVMAEWLLQFEYTRAGFPEDFYGFSTEDRLTYGVYGIRYILNDEGIDYLGDLTLPGELCYPPRAVECPMFNQAELKHMEDVKAVASGLFTAGWVVALLAISAGAILWRYVNVDALRLSLMQGSLLTIGLIIAIIMLAVTAWDMFFTAFHDIFFEEGTWRFYWSDTLIRLYPEQFWFDAALLIGFFTSVGAIAIFFVTWRNLFTERK